MLARGTVIDRRFKIELAAGSGGFGTVYRDGASLDLVDAALREVGEQPLAVVGFARPELISRS